MPYAVFFLLIAALGLALVITFCAACKARLQRAASDLLDLFEHPIDWGFRVWAFLGPRLMNRALWVAIAGDAAFLQIQSQGGNLVEQAARHPLIFLCLLGFNLLTPLTPTGAPERLPPAGRFSRAGQGANGRDGDAVALGVNGAFRGGA